VASDEPTHEIANAPATEPATTAIPTQTRAVPEAQPISSEETRAIPVSRPESGDTDTATEQLNARAKTGGGLSAADLLRREGRL
jgi:RND superfamily putative drug exporter